MRNTIALLLCASILGSCSATSGFQPGPEVAVTPNFKQATRKPGTTIAPSTQWWANFGDANLNRLVEEALAQNLTVELARERVRAARLSAKVSKGAYYPSITASYSDTRSGTRVNGKTTNTSSKSAGLNGSWTLDFLGGKSTADREAAKIEAQKEALNGARLDIIASMVTAYLNAQGIGQQLAISRKSLSVQKETLGITRAKLEAGSASALDSTRAAAQTALTSADIPSLQESREQAINQIALLLGKQPAELNNVFTEYKPLKRPKVRFSEGVPADLLRNRPDIREAERTLAAAVADIGVAEADLLPSLSLSGSLKLSGSDLATKSWSFGPAINLPIFNRGTLKASVDLAKSSARQDYLTYRETVIAAVGEVEDALVALKYERDRNGKLAVAVSELRKAEALARQLYTSGSAEFSDVLDAQDSLYSAELQLASSSLQLAVNYVVLCQALGGGWDGDEPVKNES
ncbi:efflux transporter outer membrane subunit [Rhizobium alvei]|uniref:Efflux transporter outer membrane subunit n=1 Tax=Rhizobium alvei TaxID=1132659 RepID=A0ABT8YQV3_9HYPH|nr:efflux transporter outer membrane subunit [Rhizobium alvei]MDO6965723.1 efflux transporter outer membrane subunit [Rhizobium alvei]